MKPQVKILRPTAVRAVVARAAGGPADSAGPTAAPKWTAKSEGAARAEKAAKPRPPGSKRSSPAQDGGKVAAPVGNASDAAADPNSLCNIAELVGVRPLWKQGGTGQGIDVALIDSGVAPVTGLAGPGQVLNGPDLTPESQDPATRYLEPSATARTWPGSSPGATRA